LAVAASPVRRPRPRSASWTTSAPSHRAPAEVRSYGRRGPIRAGRGVPIVSEDGHSAHDGGSWRGQGPGGSLIAASGRHVNRPPYEPPLGGSTWSTTTCRSIPGRSAPVQPDAGSCPVTDPTGVEHPVTSSRRARHAPRPAPPAGRRLLRLCSTAPLLQDCYGRSIRIPVLRITP
jgi:hypothetical protein